MQGRVQGANHVPLYVKDDDVSIGNFIKQVRLPLSCCLAMMGFARTTAGQTKTCCETLGVSKLDLSRAPSYQSQVTSVLTSSCLMQATHFGMGGWWEGGAHTRPNKEFLKQVHSLARLVMIA